MVPGRPRDLSVIEATKNYVVLSWNPPGDKGHEGVMYYVEKVREQTEFNFITTASGFYIFNKASVYVEDCCL